MGEKNSFTRALGILAKAKIFPKTCGFFVFFFFVVGGGGGGGGTVVVFLWLEEGGCLYFLSCFSKSFRMLMPYTAYKYDPEGSSQKSLMLYKGAVRKTR